MTEFNFKVGDRIRRERLTASGGAVITAIGEGGFLARGAHTNVPDAVFYDEAVFTKAATDHGPWVRWKPPVPPCPFEVGDWVYRNARDFPDGPRQVVGVRCSNARPAWVVSVGLSGICEYLHVDDPSGPNGGYRLVKVDPPAFAAGDYVVVKHDYTQNRRRVLSVFFTDNEWRFRIEGYDYGCNFNNGHIMNWWTKADPPVVEAPKTYKYEIEVSSECVELHGLAGVLSVKRVGA